jgi:hypothetical protein
MVNYENPAGIIVLEKMQAISRFPFAVGLEAVGRTVRVRVTLRLTVYRQSVHLGAKPLEVHDHLFIFSTEHLGSQSLCNILCDERLGLSFTIPADPRQRNHSQVRVPRD